MPIAWLMPPPSRSIRQVTCCSPVPDAATTPIVAAPHHIGEAERHAADDRGAAVGPHDDQIVRAGVALERDLVRERHVVAEQHDIEAEAQRLHRLGGGIVAGRRDQREIGGRHCVEAHFEAARRLAPRPVAAAGGWLSD